MKIIRNTSLIFFLFIFGISILTSSCSQRSPLDALQEPPVNTQGMSFDKKQNPQQGNKKGHKSKYANGFHFERSKTFLFKKGKEAYSGGTIPMKWGNRFHVRANSIIPPEGTPYGAPVTITMKLDVDLENNYMEVGFGPHGTQFTRPAEIRLSWEIFAGEEGTPKLYYITPDGQYIEQAPDQVDYSKKFIIFKIYHFSRYAFALS